MESIVLLATAPAILALVNMAKQLGLPGKAAMVLAVTLGVALNLADFYFAGMGAYQAASTGLILGLSAAGVYDISKLVATNVTQTQVLGENTPNVMTIDEYNASQGGK